MDSGAGCQAALQPTMSVRFWAAARMQLACQLIISFITGQKTSRRLQAPSSLPLFQQRVKNFSYLTFIYKEKALKQAEVHRD